MGGSTSKQQYHDLGELMRKKDEPAVLAELAKTKYDPDKGSRRTESCFEVAAKFGLTDVIKAMLDGKKKPSDFTKNCALRRNISEGDVKFEVVELLVQAGAEIDDRSDQGETPLMCCARYTDEFGRIPVLVERRRIAKLFLDRGVKVDVQNADKLTPVVIACQSEHEKLAIMFMDYGAKLEDVEKWMAKAKANSENWVAGSLMAKFAWKDEEMLSKRKDIFMSKFDKNKDGEIDKDELLTFLAFHYKVQHDAGMVPTFEFKIEEWHSMEDIEEMIKKKCGREIEAYISAYDKDAGGTFTWEELLPIIQDFYGNMWQKKRPGNVDEGTSPDEMPPKRVAAPAAVAPSKRPLPLNWYEVANPGTTGPHDAVYYANCITHETTWERPQ